MKKRFKKIYVEITNVCNLSCSFCPKSKRAPHFMSVDEFTHVINSIAPYTNFVNMHLMGEPLLHPHLMEFLKICHKHSLKVNLTTNASLLADCSEFLLNSKALNKISISLHSFEANQLNFTLKEYLSNIITFSHKSSNNTNIITALRLWNEDDDQIKGENVLNNSILTLLKDSFDLDFDIAEKLSFGDVKIAPRVFVQSAKKFQWPDLNLPVMNSTGFCYGLRDQIGILCDMTVVACCLDHEGDIALGNISTHPLQEIITSSRATALYNGFTNRTPVEDLCKRCGYIKRFSNK